MAGKPTLRGLKRAAPSETLVRSFFKKKDLPLSEKTIGDLVGLVRYYNQDSASYSNQLAGFVEAKKLIGRMRTMAKTLEIFAEKAGDSIDEDLRDIEVRGIFQKDFRKNFLKTHKAIFALQKLLSKLDISVDREPIVLSEAVRKVLPFIEDALREAGLDHEKESQNAPKLIALGGFLSAIGWNFNRPALAAALKRIRKDQEP